ncbi:glycerophosphodiester phosphodiesterase family protein [Sphingomonas colocasiae]|uniref:Glycerophosphodiester phosphodiesterase family protein n=1 Tax=Sphingomonas colocasiae TaxID=1848973 RepID=A0ABS7PSQ2_9SPHN|nr:glycerophosphodiester phosphodiesterase family protein [Sphingomonas colocasiae]MBY8824365.1 glycerophosphodiester phosphodiesterase family protein [Sphingomonas colocasiae]
MKRSGLALMLLLAAGPLAAQVPAAAMKNGRGTMVMAHRGCWEGGAPEVSVSAILACQAIGPDSVEIDVQRTRDGQLVLMHDDTVDRMTDGKGLIADMTGTQVRALRLREGAGGPAAPLTDEHVPTLEEGLRAAKGRFTVNLHLKLPVEQEVADIVKRLGMVGQVTTWVAGKADDDRLINSPLRGAIGMIPVVHECADPAGASCQASPIANYAPIEPVGFYVIPKAMLSSEPAETFVKRVVTGARPAGAWIMASSLFQVDMLPREERRAVWRSLIDLGVDLIMTDHPGDLIDLLQTGMTTAR